MKRRHIFEIPFRIIKPFTILKGPLGWNKLKFGIACDISFMWVIFPLSAFFIVKKWKKKILSELFSHYQYLYGQKSKKKDIFWNAFHNWNGINSCDIYSLCNILTLVTLRSKGISSFLLVELLLSLQTLSPTINGNLGRDTFKMCFGAFRTLK